MRDALMNFDSMISQGYISRKKHPEFDLYILNYTPKTQYERFWNEYTINCRGLIVDSQGTIKARCFQKFFNYEEVVCDVHDRLERGLSFEIFEKIDGSLGILYWVEDKPFIATRGSFSSEQANMANEILKKYDCSYLDKSLTYLFEIIYPENKICVDYNGKKELVFLSAFEIFSGKEVRPDVLFPVAEKYDSKLDFNNIYKLNLPNKEGFVVRFSDGFRFKIKFEDYKRLHNLIFSISSKSLWQMLRQNKEIDIQDIPDELYSWIKKETQLLKDNYHSLETEAKNAFKEIGHLDRKDFAKEALNYDYSSILFKMLDKKDYNDIIWKMIEPEYRTPDAKVQEEA
jgi:RNA ligase